MSKTETASLSVRGLNTDFVKCRGFGHAWDEWFPHDVHPTMGFLSACRCMRCGTQRLNTLNVHGGILNRRYIWPDEYKAVTHMSRGEAQVWLHQTRPIRQRRAKALVPA
jgi:hypothetical protein